MNFENLFYQIILPFVTFISLGYIIYLLIYKRSIYENIEEDFLKAIEKNKKLSEKKIKEHFSESTNYTKQMLSEFNEKTKTQFQNISDEIQNLQDKIQETLEYQKIFLENQKKITQKLKDFSEGLMQLQDTNIQLQKEIKKRDAIIERKTKQIKRLKEQKADNGI